MTTISSFTCISEINFGINGEVNLLYCNVQHPLDLQANLNHYNLLKFKISPILNQENNSLEEFLNLNLLKLDLADSFITDPCRFEKIYY